MHYTAPCSRTTLVRFALLVAAAINLAAPHLTFAAAPAPAKTSIEPHYLSNIRQVTSGFVKAGEGYFSPDGRTIIYQAVSDEYPFYQIYTQPLAGGKPLR